MDIDDFRARQEADLQRRYQNGEQVLRRRPFHERYAHLARPERADDDYYGNDDDDDDDAAIASDSEADEEIQSPATLDREANAEEGEEA